MDWNLLDEQWRQRHDASQLVEIEGALDKALYNQHGTPDYSILWRWARLSHFRAMQAVERGNDAEAQRHFAAGAQEALQAARLQPDGVEGNFWYGVNAIEAARRRGALAALPALSTATRHINRAAMIDEEYYFAGPLRVQARITHLRPLLLGGSLDVAIPIYRRALQIAPANSTTLLYYAEALIADRQPRAARDVLQRIVRADDDPDWLWEQNRDRRLAKTLLEQMVQS